MHDPPQQIISLELENIALFFFLHKRQRQRKTSHERLLRINMLSSCCVCSKHDEDDNQPEANFYTITYLTVYSNPDEPSIHGNLIDKKC